MFRNSDKHNEIAILFSGGTDSTCAAAIMAGKFDKVNLLTFNRFGIFSIENSKNNVKTLRKKFPSVAFEQRIINADHLVEHLSHNNFFCNLFKYGFLTLSNCMICSLVNHFGALIYCLNNDIRDIADGSTKDWIFFPSHMEKVIVLFRQMYKKFNINYHTPVYNFDVPPPISFMDKIYPGGLSEPENRNRNFDRKTTGKYLYDLGFFSSSNIKGTDVDHKMQPRCLQFILHHIYVYWYFLVLHDYARFELKTLQFIGDKIDYFSALVEKNPQKANAMIS